jgi:hypothetical protein
MNFIIGGLTAVIAVIGYWVLVALFEWIDGRGTR